MPALSVGNQWSWRKKVEEKKGGNFTVFWRGEKVGCIISGARKKNPASKVEGFL